MAAGPSTKYIFPLEFTSMLSSFVEGTRPTKDENRQEGNLTFDDMKSRAGRFEIPAPAGMI